MAKKAAKPGTDKKAKAPKVPSPKVGLTEGLRYQSVGKDPKLVEHVWKLYAIKLSRRQIAEQTGLPLASVSRVLEHDPERRRSIESAAREERAKVYEQIETGALYQTLDWLRALESSIKTRKGTLKAKFSDRDRYLHQCAPKILTCLGGLGDKSTKQAQLLGGGLTERIGLSGPVDPADWTPEEIIRNAIKAGLENELPPELIEMLARKREAGELDEDGE